MRVMDPKIWLAVKLIVEAPLTSELAEGGYSDDKLDALIIAARAVYDDDEPMDF
jgi:hypothetical protein